MTGSAAVPMTNKPFRRLLLHVALVITATTLSDGGAGVQTTGRTARDGAGRNVLLPAELVFLSPEAAALQEVGRLTGRDNTANVESVLAQRPDLILDYGSVGATYASLADRMQAQTGLPDLLLDGTLARIPETYALLGKPWITGKGPRSAPMPPARSLPMRKPPLTCCASGGLQACTAPAARAAWKPASPARSIRRSWSSPGRTNRLAVLLTTYYLDHAFLVADQVAL